MAPIVCGGRETLKDDEDMLELPGQSINRRRDHFGLGG